MMEKKKLIIVGAGGFGRECFILAREIAKTFRECPWVPNGFLDDRPGLLDGTSLAGEVPIVGSVENHLPATDEVFFVAVGDPEARSRYALMLVKKGARFGRLIAREAIISSGVTNHPGSLISAYCLISCDVTIGRHSFVSDHSSLSHDVSLGRCCHIGAHVFIGGGARIGNRVTIHPHATILPNVVVEDQATVGAGSVVLSRVSKGETVFGVPARTVRA